MPIPLEVYFIALEMAVTIPLIIIIFREIESLLEKVSEYIDAMNSLNESVATINNEAIDHLYKMIEDLKGGHPVKNTERPKIIRSKEIDSAKRKFSTEIDQALRKEVELKITIKKYAVQMLLLPVLVLFLSIIFYMEGSAFPFILPLTIICILAYLHFILHFELRREITGLIEHAKETVFPKSQNL